MIDLKGREIRVRGDPSLKPEEDGSCGEGGERRTVECAGDNQHGNGEKVLEVVIWNQLFLACGRDLQKMQIKNLNAFQRDDEGG